MKEKVLLISHSKDPDGIISQALIIKHLRLTSPSEAMDLECRLLDYSQLAVFFNNSIFDGFEKIFISDLPLVEQALSDEQLISLSEKARLYYFDHHYLSTDREKLLNRLCFQFVRQGGVSASELIFRAFSFSDDESLALSKIAHSFDFNIRNEYFAIGERIMKLINGMQDSDKLLFVQDIAQGIWMSNGQLSEKYQRREQEIQLCIEQAYHVVEKTRKEVEICGHLIAIAYSPQILYMKLGMRYLESISPNCSAILLLTEGESNLLFSSLQNLPENVIPVLPFCIYKKGGGRDNAGGFSVGITINKRNYHYVSKKLLSEISEFFQASNKL
ncbi:hypothetical protein [Paenibacillus woosongensis]|uniref:Uncharacterized protein n=1 Tax=Paenibacillus woosongensis TaxID=307580 RepID=A0A7X2Z0N6_9BACL|nr:hypothetical protein [Paenibacillus woosongensis]MUG45290.1 hypothetical protein [Paenibacillus woosongensis]